MEKYCESCGRVFKDSDFKLCPYCGNQLSTRAGRQPIPRKLRHQVFQRDNYRCRECGATNKQTRLHVDHIVPVAKGGTNELNNLQTLCEECNRAKYTDVWVGGEISQKNRDFVTKNNSNTMNKYDSYTLKNTNIKTVYVTPPKPKKINVHHVVKCECGFKYNSGLHDSCPNCGESKSTKVINIERYNKNLYNKCPICNALYGKNYERCPYCLGGRR